MDSIVAIVGSSGFRSIGLIAIDYLIKKLSAKLLIEIQSSHFPLVYETRPSYASHPDLPGVPGVTLENGVSHFPSVKLYESDSPRLLLTRGYHANFRGQYEVAEQVLDFYQRQRVRRLYVLAGCGIGEERVSCAATSADLINEMKSKRIQPGYEGPFMGFSGLILGLASLRDMEGICLFGKSQPNIENPELPDAQAAKAVLETLSDLVQLNLDLTGLLEKNHQSHSEAFSF